MGPRPFRRKLPAGTPPPDVAVPAVAAPRFHLDTAAAPPSLPVMVPPMLPPWLLFACRDVAPAGADIPAGAPAGTVSATMSAGRCGCIAASPMTCRSMHLTAARAVLPA